MEFRFRDTSKQIELGLFSKHFGDCCAKELEAAGNGKERATIKSAKENLFVANGVFYPTPWKLQHTAI